LFEDRLERAAALVMAELDALDVVRDGPFGRRDLVHALARHEQELGLRIDEFPDQPGAGDAIDLDALAGNPLHDALLSAGCSADCSVNCGAPAGPQRAWNRKPTAPTAPAAQNGQRRSSDQSQPPASGAGNTTRPRIR